MRWVSSVILDVDKEDVGTASAAFTDTDSAVFSYSRRAAITAEDAALFVAEAIAARNAWRVKRGAEVSYNQYLDAAFVTADV